MTEEQRLHQLRETSGEYAKAKAEREYLDHFRKSHLAILKKDFSLVKAGKNFLFPTDAAQEREARADQAYLDTLAGLRAATETEARLFWELKIAMAGVEIWRSKQATERAERKGYGA